MAIKAKKRKLSVTTRTDQNGRAPTTTSENELQRQEDEMLAMSRLLKQVNQKDVYVVAKHILTNTIVTGAEDNHARSSGSERHHHTTSHISNGASSTSSGISERLRQHRPRKTRSFINNAQMQQETSAGVARHYAAEGQSELTNTRPLSESNAIFNGKVSTFPQVKLEDESPSPDFSQHDEFEDESDDSREQSEEPYSPTTAMGSGFGQLEAVRPKRAFVSVLRSGRRRVVPLPETTTYIAVTDRAGDGRRGSHSSVDDDEDRPTSYVASVSSDSSSMCSSSGSSISVTFRAEGESSSTDANGYDIPITALVTPRLTKSLIQQKARSTYAPSAMVIQDQPPKRRPGRPPGYFLGPTSCAYCRTQHRRCDYNTVCMRCVKAKIPCDRSGTVERPSVIVREARQQAKAEAAAALAAAVAAGLAVPPEKPRPPQRHTQLHSLKLEAAVITSRMSTPTPVPPPSTGAVKRRRTPSPSDVTKDNIIDRRTKRLASLKPVEKYDPSIYLKPKRKTLSTQSATGSSRERDEDTDSSSSSLLSSFLSSPSSSQSPPPRPIPPPHSTKLQRGRSRTRGDNGTREETRNTTTITTGVSSRSRSLPAMPKVERDPIHRGTRRYIGGKVMTQTTLQLSANGRTQQRGQEPRKPIVNPLSLIFPFKRGPGRPSNAMRLAMSQALLQQQQQAMVGKVKRGPGRPRKDSIAPTSTSISTTIMSKTIVPMKRTRSATAVKMTPVAKATKGKQAAVDTEEDSESVQGDSSKTARLVKKAYLKSGLYSVDLKVNPGTTPKVYAVGSSKQGYGKSLIAQSRRGRGHATSGPFFQLPINYGSVLMAKQEDFRLPFDIMQAWQAGALRKKPQPEPFVKIRSNVFVERKRRTETSPMVCHCKPPPPGAGRVGCGEDCYNRVMFYECISAYCPCGDQCSNQRFQKKHDEDHLQVIWTQERGFGIQTLKPIKKGSLVIEYRGEVISQSECHRRMETIYKNNKNFYFLEYEKGEVVDACQKGTNARFVNHSCSPNSQIEKWYLNGEMSIGIFASQDVPAGAEISYDYNFSSFSGAQKQKCRCGAPNCRGYIGERISKNKETVPSGPSSGRTGKKVDGRKRKAGRRKLHDQESSSLRLSQMPTLKQIRQRQADKHKGKMAAIRYTRLFLFRNIHLVESKYIKYAQTKSRSYHESASRSWLVQARQCRKRNLEQVVEDLRATVREKEEQERSDRLEEEQSGSGDEEDDQSIPSRSATADGSFIVEQDSVATDGYDGDRDKAEDEEDDEDDADDSESSDDDDDEDEDNEDEDGDDVTSYSSDEDAEEITLSDDDDDELLDSDE